MAVEESGEVELPLDGVGARLLRAREAAGMTRSQLAAITKIPERHLAAIETGDFAALPARTYAVGFSRSYARAVGLDESEIAAAVKTELAGVEIDAPRRLAMPSFEPSDPARVPSAGFAWTAAGLALVLILAGLAWWRGYFAPGGELPSILPEETPSAAASQLPAAAPNAAGPVVFTALEPLVWVKFTDAAGNQLFQTELKQGESYTVPADLSDVRLTTARPNALAITIGGQPVAKLAEVQTPVRDVQVTAAALLARGAAQSQPAPAASAAPGGEAQRPAERSGSRRPPVAPRETFSPPPVEVQPIPAASPVASPSANPTADR